MKTLPFCLGLVKASEKELFSAFALLADKHSRDFEILEGCKLFAQWSRAHLSHLEPFIARHGRAINSDPARVRSALFHGIRIGSFGLLRDLQDLLLLAHQARSAWTSLIQAAKELREDDMAEIALGCAAENDRQIDWIFTRIKIAAPQALTVPPTLGDELKGSLPKIPTPASMPEMAWTPMAGALTVLGAGSIALLAGQPWLLPSLGPSAYLIAETPEHPQTRLYNTVFGHTIGLAAGFLAVALLQAWNDPVLLSDHQLTFSRVGAAAIAIFFTLLGCQLSKATHPPAAATTLLVALGSLKTVQDGANLFAGAVAIALIGLLLRFSRTRTASSYFRPQTAEAF